MKYAKKEKLSSRLKRARRVRKKISGRADRPRMAVTRSLKSMYVQLIDDVAGITLLGISTRGADMRSREIDGGKTGMSKELGKLVAEKAKEKGITRVVFDRSGNIYHGRVKALADGAREGGLEF
ncbi:50S ribosomal protein L18 [Candidatus Latescibacterota bacterium]